MTLSAIQGFLTQSSWGMLLLSMLGAVVMLFLTGRLTVLLRFLVKPAVEQAFYHQILVRWLGPVFSRHKIVATFIRVQGLGDSIVEMVLYMLATFVVVACLSSSLTAVLLHVYQQGFHYSPYLLMLNSLSAVWLYLLMKNLRYFYVLSYRVHR